MVYMYDVSTTVSARYFVYTIAIDYATYHYYINITTINNDIINNNMYHNIIITIYSKYSKL